MDDDPWDDWEAAADAGFDPKPSKTIDEHEKNKQLWLEANAYIQPEIVRTDTTRTEYVPQPRILKRPKNPGPTTTTHPSHLSSHVNITGDIESQKKSLAEREAEYNIARQKIFGANANSDDNNNRDIATEGEKNEGQNLTESTSDKKYIVQIKDGNKSWEEDIHRKPERIISPKEGSNVIRQPKSPNYGQMGGFGRVRIVKNPKS